MRDYEELVLLIDDFINVKGLWFEFKDYVEERGYSLKELGFKDDD